MKPALIPILLLLGAALAGCSRETKQIAQRDLNEAKALFSESQYAMSIKEWSRAEGLLVKAIAITPEPEFFHSLGSARMRLGHKSGAKDAYLEAIKQCDKVVAVKPANTDMRLKKIQLLALVGRLDDARALEKKVAAEFPGDPLVKAFVDGRRLDALIASPLFREISL